MHIKYREAAKRLAERQKNQAPCQYVDPLAMMCTERKELLKKTKKILKDKIDSKMAQKNIRPKTMSYGEEEKPGTAGMPKKEFKRETAGKRQIWQKYLSNECDQFNQIGPNDAELPKQEKKQCRNAENSPGPIDLTQQPCRTPVTTQMIEAEPQFDIEDLKAKLGIGAKAEEPQPKLETSPQCPSGKQPVLNFEGRPFIPAPGRAAPKMIHEYPPPCKVAGLYEWPPKHSDHRMWRRQMKESRKLQ